MRSLATFGAMLLVALATAASLGAETLKLTGNAVEHKFVRVASDKAGKWVVIGPDVVTFNEQLRIDNLSLGTTAVNWRETLTADAGKTCIFCGPPGGYVVIQFVDGEDAPSHLIVLVKGAGPLPSPPPVPTPPAPIPPLPFPPNPSPAPAPPLPAGKYGMAKVAYDAAMKVAPQHRPLAGDIRDNFEAVAAGIAAGSYRTPEDATKELTARNRLTLGLDGDPKLEAWRPFFAVWGGQADARIADKSLRNVVDDWRVLFLETVDGLDQVK